MNAGMRQIPFFPCLKAKASGPELSVNQPGRPEGMVLPWLMTMPSPSEDINIGNIGARWDEKLETAQRYSVPEGPTPATQLMPVPRGQVPLLRSFRRQARMALCHYPLRASPG